MSPSCPAPEIPRAYRYNLSDFSDYLAYENIQKIEVSQDDYGDITDNSYWDIYTYAGVNDYIQVGKFWQIYNVNTQIALTDNGIPISASDKQINVYHYAKPEPLTETDDTPQLNSDYHMLLRYKLVEMIATQNEDYEVANKYEAEYQEKLAQVKKELNIKEVKNPELSGIEEWW